MRSSHPHSLISELDVGDLDAHFFPTPDFHRLADGLGNIQVLVPEMGGVKASQTSGRSGQAAHFLGVGVSPRHVGEPRGQTQGSGHHLLYDQGFHPPHVFSRRGRGPAGHDLFPDGVVSGEDPPVRRDPLFLCAPEKTPERIGMTTAVPADDRGHALADEIFGQSEAEQVAVAMSVDVDEARGDHEAFGVDRPKRLKPVQSADGGDPSPDDTQVAWECDRPVPSSKSPLTIRQSKRRSPGCRHSPAEAHREQNREDERVQGLRWIANHNINIYSARDRLSIAGSAPT